MVVFCRGLMRGSELHWLLFRIFSPPHVFRPHQSQPLVHLLIHYRGYVMKFPWGHSFPASVLRSVYLAWGSADQDTGHAVKRVLSTFVFVQFLPKTKSSVLFQNKAVCNSLKVCDLYNIEAWNLVLHAPYILRHAALFDLNTYTQQINTSQRIWI